MTLAPAPPAHVAARSDVDTRPYPEPALAPAPLRRRSTPWTGAGPLVTVEHLLLAVALIACAVGVVLRFMTHSSLWLDEALTVNISRLPTAQLLEALRHDGSPPAYYLLLHVWMKVFGQSDMAVRTLPGILSVVTLPAAWALGKALGGRRVALATMVLVATSPFAIRYGTENRMYALVMLLATLGGLFLVSALKRPTAPRLIALGITGGLLLLTHYWSLYLVAATGGMLLVASIVGSNRFASRLSLAALASGSLLFLPWAPSFLFQTAHTGTPWSTPASPMMFIEAVGEFAGWESSAGIALFAMYVLLFAALAALVAISTVPPARRLGLAVGLRDQVPGERWAAPLAVLACGTMTLALVGGMLSGAAFAYRYASVVLPAVAALVALGIAALGVTRGGRRLQAGLLALAAPLGVIAGAHGGLANRTEATIVASRLQAVAHPGDVVVYCPDQLGPAVSRQLPNRYVQVTFPRFDPPQRIDWVDYAKVNSNAPTTGLAARWIVNLAGSSHQVWLVWETGYRTLGTKCEQLRDGLLALRPNHSEPVRTQRDQFYEHESLERFAPS